MQFYPYSSHCSPAPLSNFGLCIPLSILFPIHYFVQTDIRFHINTRQQVEYLTGYRSGKSLRLEFEKCHVLTLAWIPAILSEAFY